MIYKYLYIEDEPKASEAYVRRLQKNGLLKINILPPLELNNQVKYIKKNNSKIDGLILDLRLNDKANNNIKANYIAPTLAQEVRIRSAENYFGKEFPIILFSTQQKIDKTIALEYTSDELFDYRLRKDELSKNNYDNILASIAKAYKSVSTIKEISSILKIDSLDELDERIFSDFYKRRKIPVFEYVRFILNNLILRNGPLINEDLLAARFGIDISASKDWNKLKERIKKTKYVGILSEAWERWWFNKILLWWKEDINVKINIANLNAEERVKVLKKQLKLKNLTAARPIKNSHSTRYWTICQVYKKPLDPIEGFRIQEKEPELWQEVNYICLDALLERANVKMGIGLNPLDKKRYQETKKSFSNA